MPRKKTVKKIAKKTEVRKSSRRFFSRIKLNESYLSLFLGVLVVVIMAIVITSFIKINNANKGKQTSSTHTELSTTTLPEKYTVLPGDSLWTISEKIYGSGYNWTDIAEANNITDPDTIIEGTQLSIPDVKTIMPSQEVIQTSIPGQEEIVGDSYTVVEGDNLWDIAVRAYGDGFRYMEIAKANNIANPSLIFSGNVFRIPR